MRPRFQPRQSMKRSGAHRPTIEEVVEISGIETLHPGGFALTRRTAEVAAMRPGLDVLDVSSGRGTQAVFYAREYGVRVMGVDIAPDMVGTARDPRARGRPVGTGRLPRSGLPGFAVPR